MTKASDNLFPKVILNEAATDGSDFSNPSADYRVLFLGEDGALHLKDSAGTVTAVGAAPAFHGVLAYCDTTQGFGATTVTAITFNQEAFDTDGYHDTGSNTDRITIPTGLGGYYLLTGFLHYNVTSGDMFTFFTKNGTTTRLFVEAGSAYTSAADNDHPISTIAQLADGDYVVLCGYHSQSGTQTVGSASIVSQQSMISAIRLG